MKPTHHTARGAMLALVATTTVGGATLLTPSPAEAGIGAAYNGTPIVVSQPNGSGDPQPVSPYPGTSTVWGFDGPIIDVNVNLLGVQQGTPADLDILLVSPSGTAVMLASDACTEQVSNATWSFDDEATSGLPSSGACPSGSYKPTNHGTPDIMRAPAPASGHQSSLSAFDGENPNGTWQLFVHDDRSLPAYPYDTGGLLSGFSVVIETRTMPIVLPAQNDGDGTASQYPFAIDVSGLDGRIDDTFVYLQNFSHSRPDDLDILLVSPTGERVLLMSDACGHFPVRNKTWRFHDGDPAMSDNGNCNLGGAGGAGVNFAPTSYQPGDSLPTPAPPGSYALSLSALDGRNPNGRWNVYINDDSSAHSGYLGKVVLSFDLVPADVVPPETTILSGPLSTTRSRTARFTFSTGEASMTYRCRLDDRPWRFCSSPKTYSDLARGRHVFRVRATDPAGNTEPVPAKWVWRIR